MSAKPKIAVIGAGVIGTTAAFRLLEQFGDSVSISIFSAEFSPHTTSDVAAGMWGPYHGLPSMDNTPLERLRKWGKDSHDFFFKVWQSEDVTEAGISLIPVRNVQNVDKANEIQKRFKDIAFECRCLDDKMIELLSKKHNREYQAGIYYKTFTIECNYFLPYLYKRIVKAGGKFHKQRIKSFDDLEEFDLVVNCTGLGAKKLVHDPDLKPVRGQVLRVKAPWITDGFIDETNNNYIIPNRDTLVLGAISQEDNYSMLVEPDDRRHILNGCLAIHPSLKDAEVVREVVGLRPGRSEIRLERDIYITKNGKQMDLIHCYGHGGSGVTLSYGCAVEVAELANDIISAKCIKSKL